MSGRHHPLRVAALGLTALVVAGACTGCSSGGDGPGQTSTPTSTASSSAPTSTGSSSAAPTASPTPSARRSRPVTADPAQTPGMPTPSTASPSTAKPAARGLPLGLSTGDARQVVTVVSSGPGDTTATLQRWNRTAGGWTRVGDAVDAWTGSGGIGDASEGSTRTPAGSFTLTQAFGRDSDPGTRLPYFRTTPSDYWISSPGSVYNTHQRCGSCGYDNGVNERLYEITPEYDYAAVIDYNTRNAPGGVRAGEGSAFFLHVSAGEPTAGCVSIPRDELVRVLTWLDPARHPRILIGTA